MLNCFHKKTLEEIRKECGLPVSKWADIRSTHVARLMAGRGCKNCTFRDYCIQNPEVMIYLNDKQPVYSNIDDSVIYEALVSRREQIAKLKKVVKDLKQTLKNINEELKDDGENET